jgi:acetyltransferase EpsM
MGSGVIINTSAVIEHECQIHDSVHIAPSATLAGNVTVKRGAFIGANAVLKQGVTIGERAVVGAGSVVLQDIPDFTTLVGNPGRFI